MNGSKVLSGVRCASNTAARNKVHSMKRAQRALYHGRGRMSGNNISFSHRRTRRIWMPNVQTKTLRSDLLGERLKLRVTTRALRCIDKAGGLDNYLLYTKKEKMASQLGTELQQVLKAKFKEKTGVPFRRFERTRNEQLLAKVKEQEREAPREQQETME